MRKLLFILCLPAGPGLFAQDTARRLQEVTVHAYEQQSPLLDVPAAINYISPAILSRYDNASVVNAVNSLPGVRMEERSPGSYRLNIRGSSMRAPFGVRNVKVYYNGIPLTDPGGTTYLNQLGYYNISALTIIKGPGSSLYGAGTGGVALIESMPAARKDGVRAELTAGSFGMTHALGEVQLGNDRIRNVVRYQRLASDGYREQSASRRDVVSWDVSARIDSATSLDAHFLYSDLMYQTPGALTLREYDSAPRMARPRAGLSPGAVESQAAIYQKMFLAGFSVRHRFGPHWDHTTTLYGLYAQLYNPGIRNYGKSAEPSMGGRSVVRYSNSFKKTDLSWLAGAEAQQNFTTQQTYRNAAGMPDTLQTDELVHNRNLFAFTQATLDYKGWTLTAGLSISWLRLRYARLSSPPYREQTLDFNGELSPRLALFKSWTRGLNTYVSAARGFSPPASSELSPSGGVLNSSLGAEYGWNYELGLRGYLLNDRLYYDVSAYYFRLNNAIVQRRDALGGDYYLNSGRTSQPGAEAYVLYQVLSREQSRFGSLAVWASYTAQQFRYKDFRQLDNDYSGNALPGTAPNTFSCGIDLQSRTGIYGNVSYYYSDAFYLNDANTDRNQAYHLLRFRIGYGFNGIRRVPVGLFAGGDNLLDQRYSSGPDINAFGGRYYNAAPGRNFYAGLSVGYR